MTNIKKPQGATHRTGNASNHLEHSYKPNEGGLKPNPPKKPSSQPNPKKK